MDIDFASQLLALWKEYLATDYNPHRHTMTDFMMWVEKHIEEQRSGDNVKSTRTSASIGTGFTDEPHSVSVSIDKIGKAFSRGEAGYVQYSGDDVIPQPVKDRIFELYQDGYTLARIRSILKVQIPISRMQTIVKRASERKR